MSVAGLTELKEQRMRVIDPPEENHGPLDTVGEMGLRALDYPSGYLRTAAAAAQGLIKAGTTGDSGGIPTTQDWMSAVKGQAPPMSEYNKRLGIPEGGSLSDLIPGAYAPKGTPGLTPTKGGLLDPTARGALSTAEDMILSPAVLAGMGKKVLSTPVQTAAEMRAAEAAARQAQMAKLARNPIESTLAKAGAAAQSIMMGTPISDAAESSGAAIYRNPFRKADLAALDAGKGPRAVSQLAMDNGIWGGSQEALEAQLRQLMKEKGAAAGAIEDANRTKAVIPTAKVVTPAMNSAFEDAFAVSPQRAAMGQKIFNELGELAVDRPNIELDDLIQYKRDQQRLADAMKQYDNPGVTPDPTGNAAIEGPLRQENASAATRAIEESFDAANPGTGGKYHRLNSEYGTARAGLPGMNSSTKSEMLQSILPNSMDIPVMGATAYATHSPVDVAAAYLASKAVQSPAVQTGGGLLLNRLGQSGIIDPTVREAGLQRYRKDRKSPWSISSKETDK
jgi:hypothetical protein